jgi:hypothetical protein
MTENQYNSYMEVITSGQQMKQRERVLHRIHNGSRTLVQIQQSITGIKMSSCSGRVSELLDLGLIEEKGAGQFWPVMDPQRAKILSKQRSDARYSKWLKQGDENGYFALHAHNFFQP